MNRRDFLLTGCSSVVATSTIAGKLFADNAKSTKPKVQLGLAAYSYRDLLNLKNPKMNLFDFIEIAAKLKVDGVELTQYYFAEHTDDYIDKLKSACEKAKLAVACLPIRNDFCQQNDKKRNDDIASVKDWAKKAARLGTKYVRIFAGNLPKGEELKVCQERCIAALKECAKAAEDVGVTLCLENHGGVTATAEGLLALVKPVNSKFLAVNLDSSNFRVPDPFVELVQVVPFAKVCQLKTELYLPDNKKEPMNFEKFITMLKDKQYSGFMSLEHEAKEDPKEYVPKHIEAIRAAMNKVFA